MEDTLLENTRSEDIKICGRYSIGVNTRSKDIKIGKINKLKDKKSFKSECLTWTYTWTFKHKNTNYMLL